MRLVKIWARSALLLLVLGGSTIGDVSVPQTAPQPADTPPSVDARLAKLLTTERTAFQSISPDRLEQLVTAPPGNGDKDRIRYSDSWLARLPEAKGGKQWKCLSEALYFESRGESVRGEFAVGEVIMNRVDSPDFPNTICGVVRQGEAHLNACQFSFMCDGKPEVIRERKAYVKAGKIAHLLMHGAPRNLTEGATYFHTRSVHPSWSNKFTKTAAIGAHLFYRPPTQVAAN